jgi:hypothetical protein
MPRKKQIVKSVKKTQKQKQKVSVVVNVNFNNKKKNVVSRQPKMIQQSSAPQVIYIQTPQQVSSNVNDRFSVPSASPHINEKVLDKTPPPPTAAVDPVTTDPRLRAELLIEEATTEPIINTEPSINKSNVKIQYFNKIKEAQGKEMIRNIMNEYETAATGEEKLKVLQKYKHPFAKGRENIPIMPKSLKSSLTRRLKDALK